MAATLSSSALIQTSLRTTTVRTEPKQSFRVLASASASVPGGRRQLIATLTAATIAGAAVRQVSAAEIGLFGIRKGLKKAEQKAEDIVKEGFEAADKGIETAEKAVATAEKEVMAAEKGVSAAVSFSGAAQAGAVVGAELVGVLVATSVVNSILGPEAI